MPSISVKDSSDAVVVVQTLPAVGQAAKVASLPVTLASDEDPLPVSISSIPLGTGASTSALQTTGNSSLSSIDGKLPALVSSRVPVDGSGVVQPVSGFSTVVSAAFARPADTNQYGAFDTVSNSTSAPTLLTFTNLARVNAGSGYIVKARIATDQTANVARFRLHLFHTAPTAINDNAPFTNLWANNSSKIGYIDFDPIAIEGTGSTGSDSLNGATRLKFVCAAASRTIYGILQTKDIFTPASAQNFFIELTAEVD